MQGLFSRTVLVAGVVMAALVAGTLALASITSGAQASDRKILVGVPDTVGLTQDSRGNLYGASAETGDVFCVPPAAAPVLLARVPGKPTSLCVSRMRTVFVGTESGVVYGVMLDGSVAKVCRVRAQVSGLVVDRDGNLMVATGDGSIVRVARSDFGRF